MRTEHFFQESINAFHLKDYLANLRHRKYVLEECSKSATARHENWIMCSRDPLYWVNTFLWLMEPRLGGVSGRIPFITFPFQDDLFRQIFEHIDPEYERQYEGDVDLWILKCRDAGVSWSCIAAFLHGWIFRDERTFAFLSYKRDMADRKNDPNSLFAKVAFLLKYLPVWMVPQYNTVGGVFTNEERGNTIAAEATIENAFRGGRLTGLFCDEFPANKMEMQMDIMSSSQRACGFRVFNGTPQVHDIFWERCNNPKGENTKVIRLYWWLDPRKAKGIYRDPKTGELRSKWYDNELARAPSKAMFDRETNLKPIGESQMFFDYDKVIEPGLNRAQPPCIVGEIESSEIVMRLSGPFSAWVPLSKIQGRPLVIGCDVSYGNGTTNSVASMWDMESCEKVATYVTPTLDPIGFSRVVYWLGKRFCDKYGTPALVNWEEIGPGQQFSRRLKEMNYPSLFRRKRSDRWSEETTEYYGFHVSPNTKRELLLNYNKFLLNGWAKNLDADSLQELKHFFFKGKSADKLTVEYVTPGDQSESMGLAVRPHGDRAIADALAVWTLETPKQEAILLDREEELRNMLAEFARADQQPVERMFGRLHPIR